MENSNTGVGKMRNNNIEVNTVPVQTCPLANHLFDVPMYHTGTVTTEYLPVAHL
jgi:hypothetical protein